MPSVRDYTYLESAFFNFTDKQRQYVFTNYFSQDDKLKSYLKFKNVKLGDNTIKEVLVTQLDFLSMEAEARQLSHVMLCWINKSDLPRDISSFKKLTKRYKDQTLLKIIEERDNIIAYERAKIAAEEERRKKKA